MSDESEFYVSGVLFLMFDPRYTRFLLPKTLKPFRDRLTENVNLKLVVKVQSSYSVITLRS